MRYPARDRKAPRRRRSIVTNKGPRVLRSYQRAFHTIDDRALVAELSQFGSQLLVSKAVHDASSEAMREARPLGSIAVRGYA